MKRVCVLLFLCMVLWGQDLNAFSDGDGYWTYRQYMDAHPAQMGKAQNFAEMVRGPVWAKEAIKRRVKIAVVYPGKQASDYWRRSVSSFEARLREHNIPFQIHPSFTEPGVDVRLQEKQIAQALKEDPDYLVFTLDAFRHRSIIERILQRGRPKLILQNITTPVRDWGTQQPFLYVGFDHAKGSRMLAQKFAQTFPHETGYAMFYGTRGYVSAMRGGTFLTEVNEKAGAQAVASFYLGFNRDRAHKAALKVLKKHPSLAFIFACSTDIALGAIDAAKQLGRLDGLAVNGWGGGASELAALLAGELDFTVMRMNDDNGVAMADAIVLDQTGRRAEVPTVYTGDMILLDQNTTREQVETLRKRAFRYSDHWQTQTNHIVTFEGR